jgi:hypothetical protein
MTGRRLGPDEGLPARSVADFMSAPAVRTTQQIARDRCQGGIRLSEHIADTDGAVVFRQACVMGLEGIVAKRRDRRYRSGRCREWNGDAP